MLSQLLLYRAANTQIRGMKPDNCEFTPWFMTKASMNAVYLHRWLFDTTVMSKILCEPTLFLRNIYNNCSLCDIYIHMYNWDELELAPHKQCNHTRMLYYSQGTVWHVGHLCSAPYIHNAQGRMQCYTL